MRKSILISGVLILAGTSFFRFAEASAISSQARTALQRDVEGYAVAVCLSAQKDPYLREQGDGWASAIVQRGKGDLGPLKLVANAVKTETAKGEVPVVHSDGGGPQVAKSMPILYCSEIIDTGTVRAAITEAKKKLEKAYRGDVPQ